MRMLLDALLRDIVFLDGCWLLLFSGTEEVNVAAMFFFKDTTNLFQSITLGLDHDCQTTVELAYMLRIGNLHG